MLYKFHADGVWAISTSFVADKRRKIVNRTESVYWWVQG